MAVLAGLATSAAAARTFTFNVGGKSFQCQSTGRTVACEVDGATVVFDGGGRPAKSSTAAAHAAKPTEPAARARVADTNTIVRRTNKTAVVAKNERLYRSAAIDPNRVAQIDETITRILQDQGRFLLIARLTGVPWQVVGIIHALESDGDFGMHLHNGDPLSARTVNIPRGRPASGGPPFTWLASAIDAIEYDGLHKEPEAYATIGGTLYWLEVFNGFGYRERGVNSAYIWACTNHYDRGLFVRDNEFHADKRPEWCGAAALLMRMVARGDFTFAQEEAKNAADKPDTTGTGLGARSK